MGLTPCVNGSRRITIRQMTTRQKVVQAPTSRLLGTHNTPAPPNRARRRRSAIILGMASRTTVTLIDDLDGSTGEIRTVSVSLDGEAVEPSSGELVPGRVGTLA